jgi:hypothetical protein
MHGNRRNRYLLPPRLIKPGQRPEGLSERKVFTLPCLLSRACAEFTFVSDATVKRTTRVAYRHGLAIDVSALCL